MKLTGPITCAVTALAFFSPSAMSADGEVQAIDLVNIFETLGGKHPGYRKAHARGVCATGTFAPQDSAYFTGATLLAQGDLNATLRFSVGAGDPSSDERQPGTRGVGLQITLPNGAIHNFTGNNVPVFAGKDPATFFGFLSTLLPDEDGNRDPARTVAYVQQHPSVQANVAWQKNAQTAASFANTQFWGIHTFFYNQNSAKPTKFRWQLEPKLGVKTLSSEEASQRPDGFLESTLASQIEDQTVSFHLYASIGEAEDSDIDPSQQWPDEREKVALGTVTLSASGGDACKNINFDPNIVSAGFSSSDDPVLKMRSPAYAISYGKRLSGQ